MMSKEETIGTLENAKHFTYGDEKFNDAFDSAINYLKEAMWIPVTERLPEEGEKVLATHLGGLNPNRQVIEHIYDKGFTLGWDMDLDMDSPTFGQRYMGDVIAWMPEPEPYEEGE